MSYLIYADYSPFIQDANFQQIQSSVDTNRLLVEQLAQSEAISYLKQKYDTDSEFTDTPTYAAGDSYNALGRTVETDIIYYLSLPYPLFSLTGTYKNGDRVFWKNKIYQALIPSASINHYSELQIGNQEDVPYANIFPDDATNGTKYWGTGISYSVKGLSPTATASTAYNVGTAYSIGGRVTFNNIRYECLIAGTGNTPGADITHWQSEVWTKGDNRNPQMVKILIDICLYHLHSRIAPRNIPELRKVNYHGREEDKVQIQGGGLRFPSYSALGQLQAFCFGELSPSLPLLQPRSGRISFGGEVKKVNSY